MFEETVTNVIMLNTIVLAIVLAGQVGTALFFRSVMKILKNDGLTTGPDNTGGSNDRISSTGAKWSTAKIA